MFRYLLFPVLNALGSVLAAFAALMLVPALYSWAEGDGAVWDFLYSVGITFAAGTILFFTCLPFRRELTARHGFLLVTLSWTLTSAFATIPLLLNQPQYNFSELYFETVSCITTTGSTVITGLDSLPPSINGWRCFLSWVGGMGLIVFSVAILPLLGIGGTAYEGGNLWPNEGDTTHSSCCRNCSSALYHLSWNFRDMRHCLSSGRYELARCGDAYDDNSESLRHCYTRC